MKHTRDEAKVILLQSLLGGRKFLDFARTPVDAVDLAMEMVNEDPPLITIHEHWVAITEAGHVFLQKRKAIPPAEPHLSYRTTRYRDDGNHEKRAGQPGDADH